MDRGIEHKRTGKTSFLETSQQWLEFIFTSKSHQNRFCRPAHTSNDHFLLLGLSVFTPLLVILSSPLLSSFTNKISYLTLELNGVELGILLYLQ